MGGGDVVVGVQRRLHPLRFVLRLWVYDRQVFGDAVDAVERFADQGLQGLEEDVAVAVGLNAVDHGVVGAGLGLQNVGNGYQPDIEALLNLLQLPVDGGFPARVASRRSWARSTFR